MSIATPLSSLSIANLSVRKQNIARHFSQASDYEQHADIQQQVCQLLLANIINNKQDSVLEVGAGTGQMTRLLAAQVQSTHWVINELAGRQLSILQSILPAAKIAIGDAETINSGGVLDGSHSLIVSANAVQWFDKPLSFIEQSHTRLQSGGQLLFNTFTSDNFLQIKALTGQGLIYPTIKDWQTALDHAGFGQTQLSTQRFTLQFARPFDVLKHMQLTGVSTNQAQIATQAQTASASKPVFTSKPFRWTKLRLQKFESEYWQRFGTYNANNQPCVELTYEALIIGAVKP